VPHYVITVNDLEKIGWFKGTKVTGEPSRWVAKCVNIENEHGDKLSAVPLKFLEEIHADSTREQKQVS